MSALFYVVLVSLNCYLSNVECFTNVYPKIERVKGGDDLESPLILTPLINQGKIEEARRVSRVHFQEVSNVDSYSAYFTVNENFNSNLFFWFFPSQVDYTNDPVLLWLQGGPGSTSLFGLFSENGPFVVTPKLKLKLRKYSWTHGHSVLYIDNPVGTGYSFTNNGYSQNETVIGENLYNALQQFFQLFPELQKNPFYVTGESYAGNYDMVNIYTQLGLVDLNVKKLIKEYEVKARQYIKDKEYEKAFHMFDDILNGDLNNHNTLFKNTTGFDNYFNFLTPENTDRGYMGKFIQQNYVRKAIHVGNATFNGQNELVELNLRNDIMQSVTNWISELLSNYKVLIYNGQLDIIVAYPLTINYLSQLNFSAANEYKTAKRHQWRVDYEIAGYVKKAGNLTEVLVRNAGHMVPADQPKWAFDLITRFTHNKSFY
ncbi:hypothetical protein FQA39_LY05858 [Lamprigera yunnana]|nr:hypothetical protein FQA39_LY05858 [Lamprigera yunnana]